MNAFDNRSAMSGVIEPRSFTILDSVFRDTPKVDERLEMDKDNGSK